MPEEMFKLDREQASKINPYIDVVKGGTLDNVCDGLSLLNSLFCQLHEKNKACMGALYTVCAMQAALQYEIEGGVK